MMGPRIRASIVKETWAILRDPRARLILIAPPLIQLLIFGFASTMEVKNFRIGVLDLDNGRWSTEFVERLAGSPSVREIVPIRSDAQMREAIDSQQVIAVLRFGPNFSEDITARRGATLGTVYDGRRSNAAQLVSTYIARIAAQVGISTLTRAPPDIGETNPRFLFNPNLEDLWFVMPALIAIIAAISVLAVVSQSVARERELNTFEQLMVSPLRTHEILIGKMVPPMVVGFLNVTLFVVLLPTAFGLPLSGSLPIFYFALIFYLLALTGLGMLISCVSFTQQQAFLGMFAITVPMVILSGYAGPVDNMPTVLQVLSWFNPTMWFVEISEGTFLKSMPAGIAFTYIWPMALIAVGTIWASFVLFRLRME